MYIAQPEIQLNQSEVRTVIISTWSLKHVPNKCQVKSSFLSAALPFYVSTLAGTTQPRSSVLARLLFHVLWVWIKSGFPEPRQAFFSSCNLRISTKQYSSTAAIVMNNNIVAVVKTPS